MNSAKTRPAKPHGLALWWTILVVGCVISVVLNLWHALTLNTDDKGSPVLGVIFAIVPVLFAALLSHGLVSPGATTWFKAAILALFGISMITSVSSQATVMMPYGGGYGGEWSIPIVLDASAILALYFITSRAAAAREAIDQASAEADLEAIRAELRPPIEAAAKAELRTELAAGRAELQAELAVAKAELEAELFRNRGAELAAARAEVEAELRSELDAAVRARLEAAEAEFRMSSAAESEALARRVEVETEARVRREIAEQAKAQGQRRPLPPTARKAADTGLTTKDRAKILLADNPEMTGAELGRALGFTERYGLDLLKKIQEEEAGAEDDGPDNLRFLSVK
jgi:hypothetical protein